VWLKDSLIVNRNLTVINKLLSWCSWLLIFLCVLPFKLVCGFSLAGIGGSNPAGGMDVCRECCVLAGRGLFAGLITRPEESYRVWGVWVWWWSLDIEESQAHSGLLRPTKWPFKSHSFLFWRMGVDEDSTIRDVRIRKVTLRCMQIFACWTHLSQPFSALG
jgi:hypothetical protein